MQKKKMSFYAKIDNMIPKNAKQEQQISINK